MDIHSASGAPFCCHVYLESGLAALMISAALFVFFTFKIATSMSFVLYRECGSLEELLSIALRTYTGCRSELLLGRCRRGEVHIRVDETQKVPLLFYVPETIQTL